MFQSSLYHQLQSQWRSGRLPHAILLDGPEGAGHMAVALDFARLLLCETPQQQSPQDGLSSQNDGLSFPQDEAHAQQGVTVACGACPGCAMTHKWAHPDLHFVFPVIRPKSASSTTRVVSDLWIKEWREMLKKTTHFDLELWEKEMGIENQQPHIGVFNHCRTLYVTTPYDRYLSVCLCISAGMLKVDGSQFIASSCPYCGQLATMKRYNIDIRHAIKQAQRCFATHCRDTTTLYEYVQAL